MLRSRPLAAVPGCRRAARHRTLRLGALLLCAGLLGAGCADSSPYMRSRGADAADFLPWSVAWGWGISASVKATPLLDIGLGASPVVSNRYGYDDRTIHGEWHEYQTTFPWTFWLVDMGRVPPRPYGANTGRPFGDGVPLDYRWQATRDAPTGEGALPSRWEPVLQVWGRHPSLAREMGGALLIPEYRRAINWTDLRLEQGDIEPLATLGTPARATLWEASRDGPDLPRPWDLFEVDVFAGFIGVRVGVRPLEFCDFILGWFGIDLAGDDIKETTSEEPRPEPPLTGKPPPAAAPPAQTPAAPAPEPVPAPAPAAEKPPAPEPAPPPDTPPTPPKSSAPSAQASPRGPVP